MTPTVIQRLRETAEELKRHHVVGDVLEADWLIMEMRIRAVEQELAAKDAEIARRLSFEEYERAVEQWVNDRHAKEPSVDHMLRDLYAQKARAEAPK